MGIRTTQYGKVKVDEFLAVQPKASADVQSSRNIEGGEDVVSSPEKATENVSACCAAKTCSSTNRESTTECESGQAEEMRSRAETRFGITSFVYSTERVMSRQLLMTQLGEWQNHLEGMGDKLKLEGLSHVNYQASTDAGHSGTERAASPLAPILRSKGILLMDADPEVAFYWSHAGKSISFSVFGPWPENIPQDQAGFGARRTELVFIGAGYDETSIRGLLDSCLL